MHLEQPRKETSWRNVIGLTISHSPMMSVTETRFGCIGLIFIYPGVKINGVSYDRNLLLLQQWLSAIFHFTAEFFIFHRDSSELVKC